jgi:hypothetical protein
MLATPRPMQSQRSCGTRYAILHFRLDEIGMDAVMQTMSVLPQFRAIDLRDTA